MSSATDFGCKVTARILRSKIFPTFFQKFFSAINDTCQGIVKLSNCQTHFFRCHLYSKISHPCIFIISFHMHKTFKGIAQRGKCSMGWFFGFKLHLICNEKGELLNFMITPGEVDDRKALEYKAFVKFIYGKLVGDKGYIGKRLFERLFVDGIQLITKLKSNMKGALMSVSDKLLLRKRAIIETVNDELKNIAQVEHSRHRSFGNFVVNLLGGIAAYCYFPKKPSIRVQTVDISNDRQLTLF